MGGSAILKYHFCIALHTWQMCCIKGRNTPIFEPTCVLLLFQNHILTFWEAALLTTSLKSAVVLNCHSEQLCSFPMLKAHNCQSQMKIKHQQYCGKDIQRWVDYILFTAPHSYWHFLFLFLFFFFSFLMLRFCYIFTRFIKCNASPSAFNSSGTCWNKWLNLRRLTIKLLIKWVEMLSLHIFSHSICVRTAVLFCDSWLCGSRCMPCHRWRKTNPAC